MPPFFSCTRMFILLYFGTINSIYAQDPGPINSADILANEEFPSLDLKMDVLDDNYERPETENPAGEIGLNKNSSIEEITSTYPVPNVPKVDPLVLPPTIRKTITTHKTVVLGKPPARRPHNISDSKPSDFPEKYFFADTNEHSDDGFHGSVDDYFELPNYEMATAGDGYGTTKQANEGFEEPGNSDDRELSDVNSVETTSHYLEPSHDDFEGYTAGGGSSPPTDYGFEGSTACGGLSPLTDYGFEGTTSGGGSPPPIDYGFEGTTDSGGSQPPTDYGFEGTTSGGGSSPPSNYGFEGSTAGGGSLPPTDYGFERTTAGGGSWPHTGYGFEGSTATVDDFWVPTEYDFKPTTDSEHFDNKTTTIVTDKPIRIAGTSYSEETLAATVLNLTQNIPYFNTDSLQHSTDLPYDDFPELLDILKSKLLMDELQSVEALELVQKYIDEYIFNSVRAGTHNTIRSQVQTILYFILSEVFNSAAGKHWSIVTALVENNRKFGDFVMSELTNQYVKIMAALKGTVSLKNKLYLPKTFRISKQLKDGLLAVYNAEVETFDVNNKKELIDDVNVWIKEQLPFDIRPLASREFTRINSLFLVNTLTFKIDWFAVYDVYEPYGMYFITNYYPYLEEDGNGLLKVPLNNKLNLILITKYLDPLSREIFRPLSMDRLKKLNWPKHSTKVRIEMPKTILVDQHIILDPADEFNTPKSPVKTILGNVIQRFAININATQPLRSETHVDEYEVLAKRFLTGYEFTFALQDAQTKDILVYGKNRFAYGCRDGRPRNPSGHFEVEAYTFAPARDHPLPTIWD